MTGTGTFLDVFDCFDQAVLTTARSGRVLSFNSAAASLFGLTTDDAVGEDLGDVMSVEEPVGLDALVRAAIDSRGSWSGKVKVRSAAGHRVAAACTVTEVVLPGTDEELEVWILRGDGGMGDRSTEAKLRQVVARFTLSEEQQRRAIAEDLHDHLGQGLALVQMRLRQLQGNAVFCGLDAQIEEMRTLLAQAIRYTRTLTFEISPPVLYEIGLDAALESLAEQLGRRHGLKVVVRSEQDLPVIDEDARAILFRSVRELLVNVVKHASATRVTLAIEVDQDNLRIIVEDDGRGFESGSAATWSEGEEDSAGFGLFSISERLKLLGGRLDLLSRPGGGTRATIEVPPP